MRGGSLFKSLSLWSSKKRRKRFCNTSQRELQRVKMCLKACPYDVPRFDSEHKIVKCDGCSVRVAMGLEPACVRACNTGALKLV